MLGAAASDAGGLAEDFVEPFLRTMGAAVVAGASGLEDGAVLVVLEVAGEETEGLVLAGAAVASSFPESSVAELVVDNVISGVCDGGSEVPGADADVAEAAEG